MSENVDLRILVKKLEKIVDKQAESIRRRNPTGERRAYLQGWIDALRAVVADLKRISEKEG